eukprot:s5_g50.t1
MRKAWDGRRAKLKVSKKACWCWPVPLHLCTGDYFRPGRHFGDDLDEDAHRLRCGVVAGEVSHVPDPTAKPLDPDRLQFQVGPHFDPRKYFDAATLKLYDFPLTYGIDPDDAGEPPRVQVRASPKAKIELFKKMAAVGLHQPIEEGSFLGRCRNGLFAVPKDGLRDRMVLDGRPANMCDRKQNRWCYGMASASALAGIYLEEDHVLVSSGEDLRDYSYQFCVNKERICRNVLQGDVSLADFW